MLIKVENLVKRYGDHLALDHLNLEVKEGEILGLLGPNGSGKTTAIHCILSLLTYDKGQIEIFGQPMRPNAYDIKRQIGIVFQQVAVFSELTVQENIHYFCSLYIKDKALCKQYVQEAMRFVELEEYATFLPAKLSGGLLRRLNIACGIAHHPRLIFMDEPTVAVDPQSRNAILQGIRQLNEQGATIIYTSHYMEEVEQLCSRIIILDHGQVAAVGSKEALKEMITLKQKVSIDQITLTPYQQANIQKLPHVYALDYAHERLEIKYNSQEHCLVTLLDYLEANHITYGRVYTEMPTLNDVFLEMTGRELRDDHA